MTAPAFDREAFLERFWRMDEALVASGFHALSPWWRAEIARFVRSGCRRWVIRAGRRAGKSSTLARLAVAWSWFGSWRVPPGDTPVISFVSTSRDESGARLRTIAAIAKALSIAHEPRGDEVVLTGARGAVCRTFACTTRSVVGHTSIAVFGDEVARWQSADTANNAAEVAGSIMPTLASQPHGFAVWSSSPWAVDDYHAEMFDAGNSDAQCVSFAPSWVANPTLSEQRTRELEPDERTWSREYAAIPSAVASAAFDAEAVAAAFTTHGRGIAGPPVMILDPSSGRKDTWSYCTARWITPPPPAHPWSPPSKLRPYLQFSDVGGFEAGSFWVQQSSDVVVDQLAALARRRRVRAVHADQRESFALSAAFQRLGLSYHTHVWTGASKPPAVERVRRWLAERAIALPEHATMRRELLQFEERLTPSGALTFGARGSGHDDYVSLLLTCAMADAAGMLPGTPHRIPWSTTTFNIPGL